MYKILERWKKSLAIEEKPKTTIKNYVGDLRIFFDWVRKKYDIEEITIKTIKQLELSDLKDYMFYLKEKKPHGENPLIKRKKEKKGMSATTRARRTASLKSFYNYLCEEKLMNETENIAIKLKSPGIPPRERMFLTEEKSQKFIEAVGTSHTKRNLAILMIMFNAGLRESELISLNIDDINLNEPINADDGSKIYPLKVIGKGDKQRTVYLNESTIRTIIDYIKIRPTDKGEALFLSERKNKNTGYRITASVVTEIVKNIAKKLNIKDCTPHTLRHSFATMALMNGTDLETLRKSLGHTKLETTGIYAHCIDKQKQNVANAIKITPK